MHALTPPRLPFVPTDPPFPPCHHRTPQRVSPRKSLTVILLKLLVTLAVYGPVTNGFVLSLMGRRACVRGTLSNHWRWTQPPCGGLNVAYRTHPPIPHDSTSPTHRLNDPKHQHRTTALSSPPCPCSKRASGALMSACGCTSCGRSRFGTCSSGASSTPSTSHVRGTEFAWGKTTIPCETKPIEPGYPPTVAPRQQPTPLTALSPSDLPPTTVVPRHLRPLANNVMACTFLILLSVCAYGSGGPGAL